MALDRRSLAWTGERALVERIFRSMDVRGFKLGMRKVTRVEVVDFISQTTDIGPLGSTGMLPDCRLGSWFLEKPDVSAADWRDVETLGIGGLCGAAGYQTEDSGDQVYRYGIWQFACLDTSTDFKEISSSLFSVWIVSIHILRCSGKSIQVMIVALELFETRPYPGSEDALIVAAR
ncbi:hypothetical protein BO78DRAFT_469319 [Aspergillus sclerotiicarbonarius CBS 121057]|uniref:Uncharacterized protein n=1 Tax=Aspergillus sclerotiicarbonarius (strain CBS 121057 / IBT 28362) TaxID=1448318 RepID=A0A319EY83_ASPSB|nr:hypothetical protein BO78DRAFT_469319 [Aspergillus sclerotiicarbonarius CBS 121057]